MSAITIDYETLKSRPESLEADIRAAFGNDNDALGAIIIKSQSRFIFIVRAHIVFANNPTTLDLPLDIDLPQEFPKLRERLLRLSDKFASLPKESREKYAREEQQYM